MKITHLWIPSAVLAVGACAPPEDADLTLADGLTASVFTDDALDSRHLAVAPNGDVLVAIKGVRAPGGVRVYRDRDGDGVADTTTAFGEGTGSDVELFDGHAYVAGRTEVIRYPWTVGEMLPAGPAETIVTGLPGTRHHSVKTIAIDSAGALYVNVGSPSNVCTPTSDDEPGTSMDPCPELDDRAGIWRFDARSPGQTQADGERVATGVRNALAMAIDPEGGGLYAAINGRDRLHQKYPELFDEVAGAELPAEEFARIDDGDDLGYPYCYYDQLQGRKVLAPEYGGDGEEVGRCSSAELPLIGFPGHWAPIDLLFYTSDRLGDRFRGGAFITFHGSWNRYPLPQAGFNVVFVPWADGSPAGEYEVLAAGFERDPLGPGGPHRPTGIAMAPDGALYVADDVGGWIYRIEPSR